MCYLYASCQQKMYPVPWVEPSEKGMCYLSVLYVGHWRSCVGAKGYVTMSKPYAAWSTPWQNLWSIITWHGGMAVLRQYERSLASCRCCSSSQEQHPFPKTRWCEIFWCRSYTLFNQLSGIRSRINAVVYEECQYMSESSAVCQGIPVRKKLSCMTAMKREYTWSTSITWMILSDNSNWGTKLAKESKKMMGLE